MRQIFEHFVENFLHRTILHTSNLFGNMNMASEAQSIFK